MFRSRCRWLRFVVVSSPIDDTQKFPRPRARPKSVFHLTRLRNSYGFRAASERVFVATDRRMYSRLRANLTGHFTTFGPRKRRRTRVTGKFRFGRFVSKGCTRISKAGTSAPKKPFVRRLVTDQCARPVSRERHELGRG